MIVSKVDERAQLMQAELDLGHQDTYRLCEISYTILGSSGDIEAQISSLWDLDSEVELCPLPPLRYEIEKHIGHMYESNEIWDWGWYNEA